MVFGLQTQPKSWLTGYTFWVNHYLEIVFSKISVVNPPPLRVHCERTKKSKNNNLLKGGGGGGGGSALIFVRTQF